VNNYAESIIPSSSVREMPVSSMPGQDDIRAIMWTHRLGLFGHVTRLSCKVPASNILAISCDSIDGHRPCATWCRLSVVHVPLGSSYESKIEEVWEPLLPSSSPTFPLPTPFVSPRHFRFFSFSLAPLFPLEVGPLNPTRGTRECCKLPQQGLGQSPSRNRIWCIFCFKIIM